MSTNEAMEISQSAPPRGGTDSRPKAQACSQPEAQANSQPEAQVTLQGHTMSRENLTTYIVNMIFDTLNLKHLDRSTVNEDTPLVQGGLNLDSIDLLELVVHLEKTFGIQLNESESYAQYFRNIGSVVDFVQCNRSGDVD